MKNSLIYTAESLHADQSQGYDLLIRLSGDEYAYIIVNTTSSKILAAYYDGSADEPSAKIQRSVSRNSILKQPFRKVRAMIEGKSFGFIPDELYSGRPADYAALTGSANLSPGSDTVTSAGMVNVYGQNDALGKLLAGKFGTFGYFHQAGGFIEAALKTGAHETSLHLNINKSSFEIVYIAGNRLHFYNIFELFADQDILYFLSNLAQEFGFGNDIPVILSGNIHNDDERYRLLEQTFGTISFADTSSILGYDESAPADMHLFFTLAGLKLCGS